MYVMRTVSRTWLHTSRTTSKHGGAKVRKHDVFISFASCVSGRDSAQRPLPVEEDDLRMCEARVSQQIGKHIWSVNKFICERNVLAKRISYLDKGSFSLVHVNSRSPKWAVDDQNWSKIARPKKNTQFSYITPKGTERHRILHLHEMDNYTSWCSV